MSRQYCVSEPKPGYGATHKTFEETGSLGEVGLVGRVEHDGDESVWIVEQFSTSTLHLVYERDLSDFYYWG